MSIENDDEMLQKIKECLDKVDNEINVDTPDMDKIRRLVDQVEDKKQKKNDRQFLVFIIFAAFAVSFESLAFSRLSLTIFLIVQAAALIVVPVIILIKQLRTYRRVKGI